ncbi:MAG: CapA family protein [candidate division KSB1 bacterium]|nr:CapA family protein [candidate division KSB1 bacterium]MDZ7310614.1 CapA family protein [candidate division KSB1 bacterium]
MKFLAAWLVVFVVFWFGCASHSSHVIQFPKPEPLLTLEPAEFKPVALRLPTKISTTPGMHSGVSLVAVGDVMLGSWVTRHLDQEGSTYPFESTRHILQAAHIATANLEAPFTDRGTAVADKEYTFRVPPRHAIGLKESGFDVLHLANNHFLDFGPEGLFDTIAILDSLELAHVGAGENIAAAFAPVILEREAPDGQTLRFGFLGFSMTHPEEFYATKTTPGTAFPYWNRYLAALDSLAPKVEVMVVSFHWGAEKMVVPKPYQIEMAHVAIEHGADIVLGHHPHVLQGIELYRPRALARPGLIAYSLGNFAFGSYSRSSRFSMILKCIVDAEGLVYARCLPINVFNDEVEFQPKLLEGAAATAVIDSVNALSRHLNNGRNILSPDGFVIPAEEIALSARTTTVDDMTAQTEPAKSSGLESTKPR